MSSAEELENLRQLDQTEPPPRRPALQFSIKTLFLLTLIVVLAAAWYREHQRAARVGELERELEQTQKELAELLSPNVEVEVTKEVIRLVNRSGVPVYYFGYGPGTPLYVISRSDGRGKWEAVTDGYLGPNGKYIPIKPGRKHYLAILYPEEAGVYRISVNIFRAAGKDNYERIGEIHSPPFEIAALE